MDQSTSITLGRSYSFASRLAFSPDGAWLAIGGSREDRGIPLSQFQICVRLWDMQAGRFSDKVLTGYDVQSLVFSPDGQWIGAAEGSNVLLWDFGKGHVDTLTGHEAVVRSIAVNHAGTVLASASADFTSRIWGIHSRFHTIQEGHDRDMQCWRGYGVFSVAFHPTAPMLASGGSDDTILFWNSSTGKSLGFSFVLDGPTGIYDMAFNRDGTLLAVGAERSIEVWDIGTRQLGQLLHSGVAYSGNRVAFSLDGQWLAGGINEDSQFGHTRIQIWKRNGAGEFKKERVIPIESEIQKHISDLVFSPDNRTLASSHGTSVRLWSLD